MASSLVHRTFLLRYSLLSSRINCQAAIVQTRRYSKSKKTYVQPKEEARAYILFRKKLGEQRSIFLQEWQEKQRMKMEDFNTQAAEEARIEREKEERALEANRKELERMAKKREEAFFQAELEKKRKRDEGDKARLAYESKLAERRKQEFLDVQEVSQSFITLENLDEKIQEAIENEMNYNFAFSKTGEKIV